MTDILDRVADLAIAPLTNTPLTSTDTTFEIAQLPGDIARFPDPGTIGYYAWVWAREPNFGNVGDADRQGVAERVRVTARNLGPQTLTVTRGASPIDLNAVGVTYWIVASMNAEIIEDIDDRIFDLVGGDLVTDKRVDAPSFEGDLFDAIAATPGQGQLRLFEDTANGPNSVNLQAPAGPLAGSITMTLLGALPGGLEFLTIDAAGVWGTSPATLMLGMDDTYDNGGAGLGRVITGDSGPVEVVGDGFQSTGLPSVYLFETTDASYNFRFAATGNDLLFQRGDQDADVSDDTFETLMALDAVTRRAGWNTTAPQDLLHAIKDGAGAARLRLQTGAASEDSSILFLDQTTSVWELGYDNSANGLVVGRLTFANPVAIFEDTTGQFGVGTLTPGARTHVVTSGDEQGLIVDASSTTTGGPAVEIIRDLNSIYDDGDILFPLHPNRPINTNEGDFWYNSGTGRWEGFGAGGRDAVMGPTPTFDLEAQRVIDGAGSINTLAGRGNVVVEAAASPGADDLDSIDTTGFNNGDVIILRANSGDTITVRHNIGNIHLDASANKVLTGGNNFMLKFRSATGDFEQISTMQVLP